MARARVALLVGALVLGAAVSAPSAIACTKGYSYAGLYSETTASGIAATISMLDEPTVVGASGHVAAWVGVGGPGLGPGGADEWLQVGLASFGDSNDGRLYYELAQPGAPPRYTELASGIRPGRKLRVAVVELPFSPGTWMVVSPAGTAGPFYLPSSHRAWEPIATAESYARGGQCNSYAYRFGRVQLAHGNRRWSPMRHATRLQDPGGRVRRHGASTFSASAG